MQHTRTMAFMLWSLQALPCERLLCRPSTEPVDMAKKQQKYSKTISLSLPPSLFLSPSLSHPHPLPPSLFLCLSPSLSLPLPPTPSHSLPLPQVEYEPKQHRQGNKTYSYERYLNDGALSLTSVTMTLTLTWLLIAGAPWSLALTLRLYSRPPGRSLSRALITRSLPEFFSISNTGVGYGFPNVMK